jgi:linoleoyl-CoA desaturase
MAAPTSLMSGKIRFNAGNRGRFYAVLKQRVSAHLAARGTDRHADWRVWTKGGLYAAIALGAYTAILANALPGWTMLLLAVAYSAAVLLLAINIGHDAAHDALSRHRWVNRVVQSAIFGLLGANAYLWRLRHVKSHHTFPNVDGCDIDIDENAFLRLSPNHPRRPWQRFQHLYAPLAYLLVALHTIFWQDFIYLRKRRLANLTDIRHPWWAWLLFVLGKATYVSVTFALPIAVIDLPWWQVLAGALAASAASSMLFVALLIGTHFAEAASFPTLDDGQRLPHDWAEHALVTSIDWSPQSRLAAFLAGGANTHAAHHLFPTLSHGHYRAMAPIIRATAAEFGLTYNTTTLPEMVASHFRFLRALGRAAGPAAQRSDAHA